MLFKVFDESIEQGVLVLAVTKFEPSLMGQPIRARILHLSNTLKPGHWRNQELVLYRSYPALKQSDLRSEQERKEQLVFFEDRAANV